MTFDLAYQEHIDCHKYIHKRKQITESHFNFGFMYWLYNLFNFYHYFEFQNYMDEVLSHQGTMDRVNEKAQALLATNADAKTSHAITQLTTRYQGVVAMSKVIGLLGG